MRPWVTYARPLKAFFQSKPLRLFGMVTVGVILTLILFKPWILSGIDRVWLAFHHFNEKVRPWLVESQALQQRIQALEGRCYESERKALLYDQLRHRLDRWAATFPRWPSPPALVGAAVLSVNLDGHTALIALPIHSQVQTGQLVVNHQGVVGRIEALSTHTARMILITHRQFRLPVMGGDSHQHCIIAGDEEAGLLLLYQQRLNPLKEGEVVVTSGYERLCPAGYRVGYWQAPANHVIPSVDFHQLDYVYIILTKAKQ